MFSLLLSELSSDCRLQRIARFILLHIKGQWLHKVGNAKFALQVLKNGMIFIVLVLNTPPVAYIYDCSTGVVLKEIYSISHRPALEAQLSNGNLTLRAVFAMAQVCHGSYQYRAGAKGK